MHPFLQIIFTALIFTISSIPPCSQILCSTCPPDHLSLCLSCMSNYVLLQNNTCSCQTNNAFYLNGTDCLACSGSCKTCSNNLATNCLSCNESYMLSAGSCICTIINNTNTSCCQLPCQTCSYSNSSICLTCINNYSLTNGVCVLCLTNPSSYWNGSGCSPCDSSCVTCNGSSNGSCLSCRDGFYINVTCISCQPGCKTCFDSSCTSCFNNFDLLNQQCICPPSHYYLSGSMCLACDDPCCLNCPAKPEYCQTCNHNFVLKFSSCECPVGFFQNATSCLVCHPTCQACNGSSANSCTSCDSSLKKTLNGSTCDCQTHYHQDSNNVCYLDIINEMKINRKSVIKDPFSNTLVIVYALSPYLPIFETDLTTSTLSLSYQSDQASTSLTTYYFIYSNSSLTLSLTLTYSIRLEGLPLKFSYSPSALATSSVGLSFSQLMPDKLPRRVLSVTNDSVYLQFNLHSDNNLDVSPYDQAVYDQVSTAGRLSNVIVPVMLCLFVLCLFVRKYIGLQLLGLFQIGYLSIMQLTSCPPILQFLLNEKYIFGYNEISLNQTQYLLSNHYSILGYYSYFSLAFNLMAFTIIAPFFLAFILFLISICSNYQTAKQIHNFSKTLAVEIAFCLLIFSIPNITTALTLQVSSGNFVDFSWVWNKINEMGIVLIIIFQVIIYLYFMDGLKSLLQFIRNANILSLMLPVFILIRNGCLPILIAVQQQSPLIIGFIVMSLQVIFLLGICVVRPYDSQLDFIVFIVTELGLLIILIFRYLQEHSITSSMNTAIIGLAYFEQFLYILALAMVSTSILYHLLKNRFHPDNKKQSEFPIQEERLAIGSKIQFIDESQNIPSSTIIYQEEQKIQKKKLIQMEVEIIPEEINHQQDHLDLVETRMSQSTKGFGKFRNPLKKNLKTLEEFEEVID